MLCHGLSDDAELRNKCDQGSSASGAASPQPPGAILLCFVQVWKFIHPRKMASLMERQAAERLQMAVHALQRKPDNRHCFDCGSLVSPGLAGRFDAFLRTGLHLLSNFIYFCVRLLHVCGERMHFMLQSPAV